MHSKYQQRFTPHAERDSIPDVQTRVSVGTTTNTRTLIFLSTDPVHSSVETVSLTQTSTQLVTATIVETRSASTLSSVTASPTSSSVTLPPKATSASSNSSLPSQSSTTTTTTTTSTLPISSTTGSGQNNDGAGQSSSAMIPGGTVAAIVMACLIVVILSVLFVMRGRSKTNRINRRPLWMRRTIDAPLGISSDSYEHKLPSYFESQNGQYTAPPPVPPVPQWAYTTVPPNAYNNETVVINPSVINANPNLISTPQAVYTLGLNGKRSAFEATVTSTFTTTLRDELVVEVGQLLRVMAEYDDGWALCMNERGEQGMVPIGCLDRGAQEVEAGEGTMALASPTSVKKAMWKKRSSSLRP